MQMLLILNKRFPSQCKEDLENVEFVEFVEFAEDVEIVEDAEDVENVSLDNQAKNQTYLEWKKETKR